MVVLGILCLVAANNPITFVVVIPVVILFWWLRQHYMSSSREIKRIEGISKALLLVNFCVSLNVNKLLFDFFLQRRSCFYTFIH